MGTYLWEVLLRTYTYTLGLESSCTRLRAATKVPRLGYLVVHYGKRSKQTLHDDTLHPRYPLPPLTARRTKKRTAIPAPTPTRTSAAYRSHGRPGLDLDKAKLLPGCLAPSLASAETDKNHATWFYSSPSSIISIISIHHYAGPRSAAVPSVPEIPWTMARQLIPPASPTVPAIPSNSLSTAHWHHHNHHVHHLPPSPPPPPPSPSPSPAPPSVTRVTADLHTSVLVLRSALVGFGKILSRHCCLLSEALMGS